ncbi:MAG: zf-HC2 domain-containing protein [bacterium]|nr:zf-HC2 domain-containing protein [bacterium]MCX7917241.1 zf-HC2 domain-containing protein [bacterium]MDW8164589.1 zf-HC2 domain-containing protein [Candidatus Omnitrophota bacterium]
MKCREIIKLLSEYIDREIEKEEREIIEKHIKLCKRCESILHTTEKTIFFSRTLYKNEKIPKKIEKSLFYQIRIRYKK